MVDETASGMTCSATQHHVRCTTIDMAASVSISCSSPLTLRQTTPRADGVPNGALFREEKHRGVWVAVVPLPTYLLVLACSARDSPRAPVS